MPARKKKPQSADHLPNDTPTQQRPHQHRKGSVEGTCSICGWDGTDPDIFGPGKIQQWANVTHDLCTRDECRAEYNRRARAGEPLRQL